MGFLREEEIMERVRLDFSVLIEDRCIGFADIVLNIRTFIISRMVVLNLFSRVIILFRFVIIINKSVFEEEYCDSLQS